MASRLTKFLKLFIPDLYDKGTVVTDVFDPNFTKLDQNAEAVDASLKKLGNDKLDKDLVSEDFNTAKKIEDKIKGIDEKFKNFCPFPVSSLYLSLGNENPSTLWLGTTWQKQENRFLLGAGSSYNLGATGGSSTVTLSIDNLPSHNHSASTASHTHSQPAHTHTVYGYNYEDGDKPNIAGANGHLTSNPTTSSAGGDTTGSASPVTTIGNTGNGQSFSIMPPYLAVNIWKRTS